MVQAGKQGAENVLCHGAKVVKAGLGWRVEVEARHKSQPTALSNLFLHDVLTYNVIARSEIGTIRGERRQRKIRVS